MPPARPIEAELEVLDRILGASPDAIVVVTAPPEPVFAYANDAFLRNTGYTREEVIGASPAMLEGPESADSGLPELKRALLAGESYQGDVINYRRDGTPYWVQWSISPRAGPDGALLYWIATQRDVTPQRDNERNLARALHRLSFHVSNSPLGVIEWDRDFRVISWSPQAERILGWTPDEAIGQSALELIGMPDADHVRKLASDLLERGAPRTIGEAPSRDRHGNLRQLVWYNSALRDDDGAPISILSLLQDVTEQRRAAAEQTRLERQMQHAQKLESIGVIAGGIAHDFNNLLTGVIGHGALALRGLAPDHPVRSHLEHSLDAARRAADLTRQLLFYAGRAGYEIEPLDLSQQVSALLDLLRTLTPRQVDVELVLAPDLPPIDADRAQLQQVVMNLVLNGAEACGAGPGAVVVRTSSVELEAPLRVDGWSGDELSPGRYVTLSVEDSGCGMDARTRERLYDPFFSTKFAGRGLGLAAVAGILRGHRGAIQVDSSPGRGAHFRVMFPASTRVPRAEEAPRPLVPGRPRGPVLVIDDEELVRRLAVETLRAVGCAAYSAADGDEGLKLFREHHARLGAVLLDLTLPGRSGTGILREMRRVNAGVPTVLMSGYSRERALDRVPASDAVYLAKPFDPDALLRRLCEAQTCSGR